MAEDIDSTIIFGTVLAISVLASFSSASGQSRQTAPETLIRKVVQNELSAEQRDDSHWMFRLETENRNGQRRIDEVVETKDGDIQRPLMINGQKLTRSQQQQSDQEIGKNRAALKKSLHDKNRDALHSQQMFRMLPDAFVFSYGDHRGSLVQLIFKPNPSFRPANHEAEVFHAMAGELWVDEQQDRLAEISGRLTRAVKFGGGLLGHLDKGGTFDVKQDEVAPGYWEVTVLNVQMKGKALLFKTIDVHQKSARREFKRVPDDLTISQAVELAKKTSLSGQS